MQQVDLSTFPTYREFPHVVSGVVEGQYNHLVGPNIPILINKINESSRPHLYAPGPQELALILE